MVPLLTLPELCLLLQLTPQPAALLSLFQRNALEAVCGVEGIQEHLVPPALSHMEHTVGHLLRQCMFNLQQLLSLLLLLLLCCLLCGKSLRGLEGLLQERHCPCKDLGDFTF